MNSLGRLATVLATAALAGGLASPTLAAEQATITAQITIDAPCLTVSTTSIDFGHLRFSIGGPNTSDRPLTYTNCSTATVKVYGRATDATASGGGSGQWSL